MTSDSKADQAFGTKFKIQQLLPLLFTHYNEIVCCNKGKRNGVYSSIEIIV